jgi:hypothetical protein
VFTLANRFDEIAIDIERASQRNANHLMPRAPGGDVPSQDATARLRETAFGDAGLVTRTRAYAKELHTAARALRDTATQYGLTDDTEGTRFDAAEI